MRSRPSTVSLLRLLVLVPALGLLPLRAWDYEGHRIVNHLALDSLPKEFPAFVRDAANRDRIIFLANLPDRWRNVDPYLQHSGPSWEDHFIDLEQLPDAGIDPKTLTSFRYDFALAFSAGRNAHPERFRPIDPVKNAAAHTYEWPGFAPWAIAEWYHKLRSAFGYLKAYEDLNGTPGEIANAQADVVYTMGVMGHYIGDCAQPLHTTEYHHGWHGPNPNGYTTAYTIHSWIDGGFIAKAAITYADLAPRVSPVQALPLPGQTDGRDPFFVAAVDYILASHTQVEPLYQLEKAGLLAVGDQPVKPEGRAFIEGRLLKGSEMLARVWLTAWKTAPVDAYLRRELTARQGGSAERMQKKTAP